MVQGGSALVEAVLRTFKMHVWVNEQHGLNQMLMFGLLWENAN